MNDRITAIAEHCDFYVGNEHFNESHEEKQRIWTEKFAELIVRECAAIAANANLEDVEGGDGAVLQAVATQIKGRFGLE